MTTGPLFLADGISPDNEEARRWLTEELGRPEYRESSQGLIERISESINEWLLGLINSVNGGGDPLPAFVALVVVIVLFIGGLWMLRYVRATRRAPKDEAVLGTTTLSASQFADRARSAHAAGDYDTCVLESLRTIARRAQDGGLIGNVTTMTAREVSTALGRQVSTARGELMWLARAFDGIAYGDHRAGLPDADRALAVMAAVSKARPAGKEEPVAQDVLATLDPPVASGTGDAR